MPALAPKTWAVTMSLTKPITLEMKVMDETKAVDLSSFLVKIRLYGKWKYDTTLWGVAQN